MIDHMGDCTAMPCTCGARARVWAKRNAELAASQVPRTESHELGERARRAVSDAPPPRPGQ